MKRLLFLSLVGALLLGAIVGELLCRWPQFRDRLGRIAGRGGLVKIVNGRGIYEMDLGGDQQLRAEDIAVAENLRRAASSQRVDSSRVEGSFTLLVNQFAERKKFEAALRSAALTDAALRDKLEEQLRQHDWLEQQVEASSTVSAQECRKFYQEHAELFQQPVRYRAAHLFLAAHAETPPEVADEKERAINALAARLKRGEALVSLVLEASEDKATRSRGGDLGYFSEARMPSEFMAEIKKLRPGQTSKPFRTHLGFHVVQLTEIKPARVVSFEEATGEISVALRNERRAATVDRVAREISAFASR